MERERENKTLVVWSLTGGSVNASSLRADGKKEVCGFQI